MTSGSVETQALMEAVGISPLKSKNMLYRLHNESDINNGRIPITPNHVVAQQARQKNKKGITEAQAAVILNMDAYLRTLIK